MRCRSPSSWRPPRPTASRRSRWAGAGGARVARGASARRVHDLLRRLGHDVLLTPAGPRDLPERQQTMNATIAWSYRLLDEHERRAFRRLGALPGRFSFDAAGEVLAEGGQAGASTHGALGLVASLIDQSPIL